MATVKTGMAVTTDSYFLALTDNWSLAYNLLNYAKKNWQKESVEGEQIDMLTNPAHNTNIAVWDGGDTALPASVEAATLFTAPALDWTYIYNLGFSLFNERVRNRGKAARIKMKLQVERIMARALLDLVNTQLATGDGTSNAFSGFPTFCGKTSGTYAGVTQASGYWMAQAAVDVAGIANLTWDHIENALSLVLGRLEPEADYTYYMNYAVKRYLNSLAQTQQRFASGGPFQVGTSVKGKNGAGGLTHDGNPLVVDRAFSTNLIYIAPDSQMFLGLDPVIESYPWTPISAKIGNQIRSQFGAGQMGNRRPNCTGVITFS